MFRSVALMSLVFLCGCFSSSRVSPSSFTQGMGLSPPADTGMHFDPMLSWLGGLSTLAGIVALVLTRGSMGLRAVVIGIGIVLLNQAIARYGDWLFVPTLAATGAISVSYAVITIRRMVRHRKENGT